MHQKTNGIHFLLCLTETSLFHIHPPSHLSISEKQREMESGNKGKVSLLMYLLTDGSMYGCHSPTAHPDRRCLVHVVFVNHADKQAIGVHVIDLISNRGPSVMPLLRRGKELSHPSFRRNGL